MKKNAEWVGVVGALVVLSWLAAGCESSSSCPPAEECPDCTGTDCSECTIHVYTYDSGANAVTERDVLPGEVGENDYLTYNQAAANITTPPSGGSPSPSPSPDEGGGGDDESPW